VKAGTSSFLMDEPVQAGGLGSGPNPYDLLSAAIGACALMTIRLYARREQWPLEGVRLKVNTTATAFRRKIASCGKSSSLARWTMLCEGGCWIYPCDVRWSAPLHR
jgi:hypothetical protein